ncbi:MAG: GAF domain-containing protein, partial [Actinobacteria bacterium]|nr:GAF domain-containing protein [Actinomycetota bacterium]
MGCVTSVVSCSLEFQVLAAVRCLSAVLRWGGGRVVAREAAAGPDPVDDFLSVDREPRPMLKSPKHRRNDPALRADNDGASGFAELPATELEQVLGQLAASAQEALGAQGRLRALLRATAAVADDLSLPVVLQRVVAAARELVDARYAALGVIGRNGELEQFVHAGMDAATVERVGPLPRGGGVLGLLISDPSPLRLTEMSAHPATVGFPPHHPPMGSFLGVPISVRGQIYGNLYLTESRRGEFSVEDERLITALAGSAGVAIANARLHQDSVQQRQWLAASTELTQRLFAGQLVEPVTAVLQHAVQGAGADMALLVMATGEERARVAAAVGGELAHLVGRDIELGDNLAGQVITTGKAILVEEDPQLDSVEFADLPGPIGAAIGVPLLDGDERVLVALIVAREPLRSAF